MAITYTTSQARTGTGAGAQGLGHVEGVSNLDGDTTTASKFATRADGATRYIGFYALGNVNVIAYSVVIEWSLDSVTWHTLDTLNQAIPYVHFQHNDSVMWFRLRRAGSSRLDGGGSNEIRLIARALV